MLDSGVRNITEVIEKDIGIAGAQHSHNWAFLAYELPNGLLKPRLGELHVVLQQLLQVAVFAHQPLNILGESAVLGIEIVTQNTFHLFRGARSIALDERGELVNKAVAFVANGLGVDFSVCGLYGQYANAQGLFGIAHTGQALRHGT